MAVISNSNSANPAPDEVYAVKRVQFLGKPVTYICQNINGPCPLLAISNVLLLRGHINLDSHLQTGLISASDLINIVLQRLLLANPPLPESDELGRLTQQKTLQDIQQLMPSLLVGLDVNVRFHSITDFEYTVACAVFDMLDIALVHGWLLDIQDEKTLQVVQNKSYNELIERLVDYRGVMITEESASADTTEETTDVPTDAEATAEAPDASAHAQAAATSETTDVVDTLGIGKLHIDVNSIEEEAGLASPKSPSQGLKSPSRKTVEVIKRERQLSDAEANDTATTLLEEGPVLEEFFAASASQLTYYGLVKLHEDLRERQLAVFFRNNHFSTLFKIDGALYLLVTDAGYLDEPTVVWERLNEIDGDTEYFDENFRTLNVSETRQQTIFKQQEEERRRQLEAPVAVDLRGAEDSTPASEANTDEDRTTSQEELHSSEQDADYLFALKLQQEEEARVNASRNQAAYNQAAGTTVVMPSRAQQPPQYAPDSREPSEGYDSQPPISSEGPNSNSEGEPYNFNANGELVLSETELQAQREAEMYYQQQRQLQQAQAQGQGVYASDSMRQQYEQQQRQQGAYQANRAAPPSANARRQNNDCSVM